MYVLCLEFVDSPRIRNDFENHIFRVAYKKCMFHRRWFFVCAVTSAIFNENSKRPLAADTARFSFLAAYKATDMAK